MQKVYNLYYKELDAFLLRQDDIDKLSDWSFDICVYKDN